MKLYRPGREELIKIGGMEQQNFMDAFVVGNIFVGLVPDETGIYGDKIYFWNTEKNFLYDYEISEKVYVAGCKVDEEEIEKRNEKLAHMEGMSKPARHIFRKVERFENKIKFRSVETRQLLKQWNYPALICVIILLALDVFLRFLTRNSLQYSNREFVYLLQNCLLMGVLYCMVIFILKAGYPHLICIMQQESIYSNKVNIFIKVLMLLFFNFLLFFYTNLLHMNTSIRIFLIIPFVWAYFYCCPIKKGKALAVGVAYIGVLIVLIEAKKISETLGDMQAIVIASKNLKVVNHKAKIAGMNGEKMGPAALCKCGKGLSYKECCGKADFEPEELGFKIDNISEDIEVIQQQVAKQGRVASHIDYLLRKIKENDVRLAWTNIEIHNGWIEMKELVDMANLYLVSAEKLAKEAKEAGNYAEKPLACIMLSCCALEAFINQAIYFISVSEIVIPEKLQGIKDDSFGFQRNTELTLKWNIIGEILCESEWKPCAKLWNNFINLIFIRNELVHFKVSEFEQVVPRPEQVAEALKRIPKDVELNDIPHSWPLRILNPSFAEWSVKTAKEMINYIKEAYQKNLSKVEYKVNDKR